ncbi:MAG: matrixin family metalloprotease [Solirubrobacteraceae bacterium]
MRALIAAVVALATLAPAAAPAHAYKLGGEKWPGTITYHVGIPQYADAIAEAARAWNASGAGVRLKEVASKRRARLRIIDAGGPRGTPSGVASVGFVGRRDIFSMTVDGIAISGDVRCGQRIRLPDRGFRRVKCVYGARMVLAPVKRSLLGDPWTRNEMAIVAAHEFGHVLGLRHAKNTCAVMSYQREQACPKPAGAWEKRCRLLEADDVAGAIRRYGGRASALAPEFCDLYPPPPPPLALTAVVDADGFLAIRWTPSPGVTGTVVTVARDACSADGGTIHPGTSFTTFEEPGRYCVSAHSVDAEGRAGPALTTWVDVAG